MNIDPQAARQFAEEVARKLRAAGYEALWAGGCVRDQLLGIQPKDYDVATSAQPDQIRDLFGRRRTLAIGAAFGVITVLGPREAGQIDVATFRRDAAYSDGRHPDTVTFTSAEEDARRRDFTINGLFFDPAEQRVIDYVGGQDDLRQKIIRAIGDPKQRFAEDKLRMLRAVRFAARFGFAIEGATLDAIRAHSAELAAVSAERIAAELRLILTHENRAQGVQLLADCGLLDVITGELSSIESAVIGDPPKPVPLTWDQMLVVLDRLRNPSFPMALAVFVRGLAPLDEYPTDVADALASRWKLSNDEAERTHWLLKNESLIRRASTEPWPKLQRVLVADGVEELLGYAESVAAILDSSLTEIDFCRRKLALPAEELNPPPLITGDDLKAAGIPAGPLYREILEQVRDEQLEGRLRSRGEALRRANEIHGER